MEMRFTVTIIMTGMRMRAILSRPSFLQGCLQSSMATRRPVELRMTSTFHLLAPNYVGSR
jgi:hypothetical protein